jgi:hypothetical protein
LSFIPNLKWTHIIKCHINPLSTVRDERHGRKNITITCSFYALGTNVVQNKNHNYLTTMCWGSFSVSQREKLRLQIGVVTAVSEKKYLPVSAVLVWNVLSRGCICFNSVAHLYFGCIMFVTITRSRCTSLKTEYYTHIQTVRVVRADTVLHTKATFSVQSTLLSSSSTFMY